MSTGEEKNAPSFWAVVFALEIGLHILRIAMNTAHDTGIEILQAPASHYGIETQNSKDRKSVV